MYLCLLICILAGMVLDSRAGVTLKSLEQKVKNLEQLVINLQGELEQKNNNSKTTEQKVHNLETEIVDLKKKLEYGGRNYQRLPHRGMQLVINYKHKLIWPGMHNYMNSISAYSYVCGHVTIKNHVLFYNC